jgi:hypothetical protein
MSSRRQKTPVVILADPKRSPSTSYYAPTTLLSPPRLPTDSARSHYPRVQAEGKPQALYPPFPRTSPNDTYQGNDNAMSQSSSRSNSSSRPSGVPPYSQEPQYGLVRIDCVSGMHSAFCTLSPEETLLLSPLPPKKHLLTTNTTAGGRPNGGPPENHHGYQTVTRGKNVVHNIGAGSLDPFRAPVEPPRNGVPYRNFTLGRQYDGR